MSLHSFRKLIVFILLISAFDLFGQTTSGQWVQKADMPTARSRCIAVTYGDEIYVIGGDNSGAVEIYSPLNNSWKVKKAYPGKELTWCGAGLVGEAIYAVIGMGKPDNTKYHVIAAYHPNSNSWEKIDSTQTAINDPAVAISGKSIYLISGFNVNSWTPGNFWNVNTVKEYNLDTRKWIIKATIPTKQHAASAISIESKIYVFGGIGDCFCNPPSSTVQVFDPGMNSWIYKTSMVVPMAYNRNSIVGENIYFINQDLNKKTIAYNYKSDSWLSQPSKPYDSNNFAQATYNNKIYLFGGITFANGNLLNKVHEYAPMITSTENLDSAHKVSVYPNPATNDLYVDVSGIDYKYLQIEIIDIAGCIVFKKKYQQGEKLVIDTSSISSGIYVLKLTADERKCFNSKIKIHC